MSDVSDIDYSTWLTKDQAAAAIGVTPKSIERFASAGQIQQARWQPARRGPKRVVYHPDDVARLAVAKREGPLPPFLVPGPPAVPSNGNGRPHPDPVEALARVPADPGMKSIPGDDVLLLLTAAMRVMSETSQTSVAETPWVDIPTAALILGRSQAYVRRQIKDGCLHAERDRSVVVRRKDLEAL